MKILLMLLLVQYHHFPLLQLHLQLHLGAYSSYCTLETQYLSTIIIGNGSTPRTFTYEIIGEGNGNKTLIIDTPERK